MLDVTHKYADLGEVHLHYAHTGSGPIAEQHPELVNRHIRDFLDRRDAVIAEQKQ